MTVQSRVVDSRTLRIGCFGGSWFTLARDVGVAGRAGGSFLGSPHFNLGVRFVRRSA